MTILKKLKFMKFFKSKDLDSEDLYSEDLYSKDLDSEPSGADGSYLDQLDGMMVKLHLWRGLAITSALSLVPLAVLTLFLTRKIISSQQDMQVILSPAITRFEIASFGKVNDSYIKSAFEHVAYQNSSWTYETISENYQTLFQNYYSHALTTRTKANLTVAKRFDRVRKHKMVSIFKIDNHNSEYTWCAALNMACGIVVGTEKIFIEHNQPYKEQVIAYLIFSESIYPTRNNPYSLKITRLVIGKFEALKKALEAAKEGILPEEEVVND